METAQTVEHLERLVGFDSLSENPNLGIAGFIEYYLHDLGFRVTRFPDVTGQKVGLYAEIGPNEGGVLLSGHTDVVPVEGQEWTRDPFRLSREEGRLYGRGTTDMKGYLASMLNLADAAARRELREPLKLVFSYDEEIGCVGIQQMADALAPRLGNPRACIVGEPTGMRVATGHKGKSAWRALCHGQAGHSALAPNFINALHLAGDFMAELREIQRWLYENGARDPAYDIDYSTVHVGMMSGGTALNMVPERSELTFECRYLAADSADDIRAMIQDAAARVTEPCRAAFPGAAIELEPLNAYPGLDVPEDAEIISFAQDLAQTDQAIKVAFGTEAGVFDQLGLPTLVCGPGDMAGQGHKADEFIEIAQLEACDRMMGRILDRISR